MRRFVVVAHMWELWRALVAVLPLLEDDRWLLAAVECSVGGTIHGFESETMVLVLCLWILAVWLIVLMVMVEVIRSMFGLSLFVGLLEGLPGRSDVGWAEHSWDVRLCVELVHIERDRLPPHRMRRLVG